MRGFAGNVNICEVLGILYKARVPRVKTIVLGPRSDEVIGNTLTRMTSLFNLTGHPAMSMPCRVRHTRLPIGVQVIGRYFGEMTFLRVARALERHLGERPPGLPDGLL